MLVGGRSGNDDGGRDQLLRDACVEGVFRQLNQLAQEHRHNRVLGTVVLVDLVCADVVDLEVRLWLVFIATPVSVLGHERESTDPLCHASIVFCAHTGAGFRRVERVEGSEALVRVIVHKQVAPVFGRPSSTTLVCLLEPLPVGGGGGGARLGQ